ncbi:trypsin-like peptidase domain-containing protein [Streptomyces variegatus]|uniref:trypsin-like peptidase domain-containing protein n=1 Tax=Streptomyces variegatus TaxID=284040 RepID=UPI003C30274B
MTGPVDGTSRISTGSGFVYGDDLVMTNAHVVTGVDTSYVQVSGTGVRLTSTLVGYHPGIDAAYCAYPAWTHALFPSPTRAPDAALVPWSPATPTTAASIFKLAPSPHGWATAP